jgi:hypothetical protein
MAVPAACEASERSTKLSLSLARARAVGRRYGEQLPWRSTRQHTCVDVPRQPHAERLHRWDLCGPAGVIDAASECPEADRIDVHRGERGRLEAARRGAGT